VFFCGGRYINHRVPLLFQLYLETESARKLSTEALAASPSRQPQMRKVKPSQDVLKAFRKKRLLTAVVERITMKRLAS